MASFKIMDGAMGSELIRKGLTLPEHIWSAEANIMSPDVVKNIHSEYIDAGADYITTNTFRTTPRAYQKTGIDDKKVVKMAKKSLLSAVELAKEAADNTTKVIGSIAPLEDCYAPKKFPGKNVAISEFIQLGKWLAVAKVDILLLETMNSLAETEAALIGIEALDLPIWVSFVLKDAEHLLSGDSVVDTLEMIKHHSVDCIMLNCNSLYHTETAVEKLVDNCHGNWGIYPNLGRGEPSTDGNITVHESMEKYLFLIHHALDLGASVLGACCGSSPGHIAEIKKLQIPTYLND